MIRTSASLMALCCSAAPCLAVAQSSLAAPVVRSGASRSGARPIALRRRRQVASPPCSSSNDLDGAKAAADTALLRACPPTPRVHNLAGVVAAQRGESPRAETHFLDRDPSGADVAGAPYTNLGRLYQERSAVDPGARSTRRSTSTSRLLAFDPRTSKACYQIGVPAGAATGSSTSRTRSSKQLPNDVRASPQVLALLAVDRSGDAATRRGGAAAAALAAHDRAERGRCRRRAASAHASAGRRDRRATDRSPGSSSAGAA